MSERAGTFEDPLQCWDFEADDDPTSWACCGICHYGNLWDDDIRITYMLVDGREAALCCGKIHKLVALELLDPFVYLDCHWIK